MKIINEKTPALRAFQWDGKYASTEEIMKFLNSVGWRIEFLRPEKDEVLMYISSDRAEPNKILRKGEWLVEGTERISIHTDEEINERFHIMPFSIQENDLGDKNG